MSGTSAAFTATMAATERWRFVSSTACWIKQGTAPTAVSGTAGNLYCPANTELILDGGVGPDVAAIQDAAGGKASLVRLKAH